MSSMSSEDPVNVAKNKSFERGRIKNIFNLAMEAVVWIFPGLSTVVATSSDEPTSSHELKQNISTKSPKKSRSSKTQSVNIIDTEKGMKSVGVLMLIQDIIDDTEFDPEQRVAILTQVMLRTFCNQEDDVLSMSLSREKRNSNFSTTDRFVNPLSVSALLKVAQSCFSKYPSSSSSSLLRKIWGFVVVILHHDTIATDTDTTDLSKSKSITRSASVFMKSGEMLYDRGNIW